MAQLFECDKCETMVKDAERWQVRLEVTSPGGQLRTQLGADARLPRGTVGRYLDLCEGCANELLPVVIDNEKPTEEELSEARIRRLEKQLGIGQANEPESETQVG